MAQRLGNLEDFVSEDGMGDLPLDSESIEMMLGIDASAIEVVGDGGSKPTAGHAGLGAGAAAGCLVHAGPQQPDDAGAVCLAQRAQTPATCLRPPAAKSFLIQAGRLAAYLQAGLLLPQEEEALTVRATRDALAKLEANPERLLA
jgi:hypothetical protein